MVGKEETYIKNDEQFNNFLNARGTARKKIIWEKSKTALDGEALSQFLEKLAGYLHTRERLELKGYSPEVLRLIEIPEGLTKERLKDRNYLGDLSRQLLQREIFTGDLVFDEEHEVYGLVILDQPERQAALPDRLESAGFGRLSETEKTAKGTARPGGFSGQSGQRSSSPGGTDTGIPDAVFYGRG